MCISTDESEMTKQSVYSLILTSLGDGVGTLTVVTDDIVKFRKYCEDPDEVTYSGEVHFSESDEARDPDWNIKS